MPRKASQCLYKDARDFCESYDFLGEKCKSCFDGFYLDGFGKCQMIDYRRNCKVSDDNLISNLCWKCSKGFTRQFIGEALVDGECSQNFLSTSRNCDVARSNGKSYL